VAPDLVQIGLDGRGQVLESVLAQVVDSGEVPGGGPHGDAGAGGDRAVGQRADAGLGDQLRRGASDVVDPLLGIAGASGARHVYSSRCCTNVRVQTYSNLREAEIVVVAWWGCTGGGAVHDALRVRFVRFIMWHGLLEEPT